MDIDLLFILFWAALVCGFVWLFDLLLLRKKRLVGDASAKDPILVEYAKSFFPVLLLVLVLRSFLGEPYQIPSESMVPTLEVGDFILVNKYAYGLRLPVFGNKIVEIGEPRRGEVMVFIPPHDPRYFIKRVIGLPGDKVRYENKILFINGERLKYELIGEVLGRNYSRQMREYIETIGDTRHSIYKNRYFEGAREWEIPQGKYLMMGDNRDKSGDSRLWGFADEQNIVGKAVAIWLHKEPGWHLPDFSRNRWFDQGE